MPEVRVKILFCRERCIRCRLAGREDFWLPKWWNGKTLKLRRPKGLSTYDPGPAVILVPKSLAERKGLGEGRALY